MALVQLILNKELVRNILQNKHFINLAVFKCTLSKPRVKKIVHRSPGMEQGF